MVLVSVVVEADGTASGFKVTKSLGSGLDEKAIECIQKWRFRPAENDGVPVATRAQIEISFRLR